MNRIAGTCGNCGGPLEVPDAWYSVSPPTPTCARCGAVAAGNYGPVIPMQPTTKPRKNATLMQVLEHLEATKTDPGTLELLKAATAGAGGADAQEVRG